MRTVQMTLDEELLAKVDKLVKRLRTTRSAFAREALNAAIQKHNTARLEQQHRKGYKRHPVKNGEFDVWKNEQEWGDG